MKVLQEYTLEQLKEELEAKGIKRFRAIQIFQAAWNYIPVEEISTLPLELRDSLKEEYTSIPVRIHKEFKSKDGTVKFLFALSDNNIIEGVLMQYKYGYVLCISTQVGCAMGCSFCASGLDGKIRNLTAGEMIGQILAANQYLGGGIGSDRKITNVVLMGSGEPLDNFDNVVKFIRLISTPGTINISQRNISLSTCGIAPKIKKLADEDLGITLTISLHATTDENRQKIMKIASVYSLADLVDALHYYQSKHNRRIVFEYIMSKGNVSEADAKRFVSLMKGMICHVNMIPINKTPSSPLVPASPKDTAEFFNYLKAHGVTATTRRTLGSDINGSCGQLRRSYLQSKGE